MPNATGQVFTQVGAQEQQHRREPAGPVAQPGQAQGPGQAIHHQAEQGQAQAQQQPGPSLAIEAELLQLAAIGP